MAKDDRYCGAPPQGGELSEVGRAVYVLRTVDQLRLFSTKWTFLDIPRSRYFLRGDSATPCRGIESWGSPLVGMGPFSEQSLGESKTRV